MKFFKNKIRFSIISTVLQQVISAKLMRRATALAVLIRILSWSISSHFVAIHSWNVCCSQKLRKKSPKNLFWGFIVVEGHGCLLNQKARN